VSKELPKGWYIVTLFDFCRPKQWKTVSTKDLIEKGYPVYGANGRIGFYHNFNHEKPTILITCRGATCGTLNITEGRVWVNGNAMALDHIDERIVILKYAYFALRNRGFSDVITGSAQPQITRESLRKIELPLAPLNEQNRIVAKLENLLAKVESCQKRLEKIPIILRRFRQSVLAVACSGRLTTDWRKNNGFEHKEWQKVILRQIADLRLGKMLDRSKNQGSPARYLRNINVRWFKLDLSNLALMQVTEDEKEELEIKNGDVLICEGGEPGRCAVWNLGPTDLVFQKAIHRVRLNKEMISDWLVYNLKNDANTGRLDEHFTGSTIKHLTGQSLAKYEFLAPSLKEQQEIVRRISELFVLADKIEARYLKIKTQIDNLTQSILTKAFRGELVPQNSSEEPAKKLFEQIRVIPKENEGRRETKDKKGKSISVKRAR